MAAPTVVPATTPRRSRRRIRFVAGTVAGLLAVGAATAWAAGLFDADGGEATGGPAAALDTAEVERSDLVQTESVSGELGYGDSWDLTAEAAGTVTELPAEGAVVEPGETLFAIDTKPVTLMSGVLPMYRTVGPGDEGLDVEQLEKNLADLGYTGFTVDDEYTWNTAEAVQEWQDDRGLPETGRVDPSQVVFTAGSVRIAAHQVAVGAEVQPGGGAVVAVGPTTQVVTIDLDVSDRELVTKDAAVTIDLPDGSTINGHIASIGTVATTSSSSTDQQGLGDNEPTSEETTIEVVVTIDDGESTGIFDQAPVEVNLESDRVEEVLSVPVAALLATGPNAYAVEVIDGSTTRRVPVETGAFAGGRVEIEGDGIVEGTLVGVPAS